MKLIPAAPLDWALLAVGTCTALIIAVSLHDFFIDSSTPSPRVRALQDVSVGFAAAHFGILVLRGPVSPWAALAGIVLYVSASLLFLSALESARRTRLPRAFVDAPGPRHLLTSGPFFLIRHPFYLSYMLAWAAAPVATRGPVITVMALIEIATYAVAARREERALAEQFGDAYQAYRRRTGMFVPLVGPLIARIIRRSGPRHTA